MSDLIYYHATWKQIKTLIIENEEHLLSIFPVFNINKSSVSQKALGGVEMFSLHVFSPGFPTTKNTSFTITHSQIITFQPECCRCYYLHFYNRVRGQNIWLMFGILQMISSHLSKENLFLQLIHKWCHHTLHNNAGIRESEKKDSLF